MATTTADLLQRLTRAGSAIQGVGPAVHGYQVEDVGTFGPFENTSGVIPFDINDEGTVVGAEYHPNGVSAFSFTRAAGIIDLGTAPNAGPNSLATGINACGRIAFMADHSAGGGKYAPGIYSAGSVTILPFLGMPGYNAVPPAGYFTYKINGRGQVVGEAVASLTESLPFVSDGRTTVSLGSLGGTRGGAADINARGEIVGYSQTSTTPQGPWDPGHAFIYSTANGIKDLNALANNPSWDLRLANAINARSEIVGYGQFTSGNPPTTTISAFHYESGVVRNLGTFVNGGYSVASGINNRGEIVGLAYTGGNVSMMACIFLPRLGAVNLNNLIDPKPGWNLLSAVAINDAGQIVGYGTRTGAVGWRGFLLTPAS